MILQDMEGGDGGEIIGFFKTITFLDRIQHSLFAKDLCKVERRIHGFAGNQCDVIRR